MITNTREIVKFEIFRLIPGNKRTVILLRGREGTPEAFRPARRWRASSGCTQGSLRKDGLRSYPGKRRLALAPVDLRLEPVRLLEPHRGFSGEPQFFRL